MKSYLMFPRFTLILLMAAISSCTQSAESVANQPPIISDLPATAIISKEPSVTTDTLTLTPTPTLIPILQSEEAGRKLLELLSNNSSCRLPCLWGITPGKSTYQEAQAIMASLSSISRSTGFTPQGGSINPTLIENDMMLIINAGFNTDSLSSHQIVSRIGLRVRNFKIGKPDDDTALSTVFDSKIFGDRIMYYSLHNQLSEQGIPSSVMISTSSVSVLEGGSGVFDILLLYPDQGILVNYSMQGYLFGPAIRGCPANAHVEIELYPTGDSDSFFEMLKQTDWVIKFGYYKPLEEVTSISIDEFYQTFREPNDKCIETLAKLWPTPEP